MTFAHRQSAHCESGVVANMLSLKGLPMSEPMAFGLASALAFAYIPLIKLSGMPLIAYRMPPGYILKGIQKQLGVRFVRHTYRDADRGMRALDELLDTQGMVGLQAGVFWLPYFPPQMQFHFNAHNLIVYGREGNEYLISDPVFETTTRCEAGALRQARFAKGALAARGLAYYPQNIPQEIDYAKKIPAAIRANFRTMTKAPLPVIGIRGIRYLAKNIVALGKQPERRKHLNLYLGHIVRMQEEIGTGGAGFRFLYASFLRESAKLLHGTASSDLLAQASMQLTDAGDEWRRFALQASKMSRDRQPMDTQLLTQTLNGVADREAAVWQLLKDI
ncbi:MAG: BtrH N-terminal domain-containing protein [Spongiibacteraceae bacterium]